MDVQGTIKKKELFDPLKCYKLASHFIILAHNIRGGYWWYGSRGWTCPPIFHYTLLPCDRWQQRGSLTEWRLIWKCVWSRGVELNSFKQKKWHPLTFTNACWTFMESKQWIWVQWGSGWCVSVGARVGNLHWYRFFSVRHAGSCASLVTMHS